MCRLAVAGVLLIVIAAVLADESIVNTQQGQVQGVVADTYRAFKGIPYVNPPTGQYRWQPPQPVTPWKPRVLNATQYGAGCPQDCKLPPHTCPAYLSEDCLTLNIFTPRLAKLSTAQPVMVFLPGGRFEQGAAGCGLYDSSYIVNRTNVIVVTVNYRLGALGWLTTNKIPGNLGLLDQREALRWVQQNIANFGGDPTKVTLFGQSAGATSTAAHLISPMSGGLFQQAIIESDPVTLPMRPMPDALYLGDLFVKDIGCANGSDSDIVNCVMKQPISNILAAQASAEKKLNLEKPLELFLPWTPVVDGQDVPMQTLDAFRQGKYHQMPIIMGTVSEEALMFIYLADHSFLNDEEYIALISTIFLEEAPRVLEYYPPEPVFGDKRPAVGVVGTDYVFTASNRNAASSLSSTGNQDIWVYFFDHALSFDAWGPNYTFCLGHVCHGAELPFVFNPPALSEFGMHMTPDEQVLSNLMIDYWTNFARTADPNQGTSISLNWPKFNPSTQIIMNFTTPNSHVINGVRTEYCDFWDELGYHWGW